MRAAVAVIAAAMVLVGPSAARGVVADKPWATVNVCDTEGHPDGVGVRGSMPGLGTQRTHMYLRIRVQFQRADRSWKDLGEAGDSGWLDAGKAKVRVRGAGQTFTIAPPTKGQAPFVLRARVAFEWRRGTVVLRRARALTSAGHRDAARGDPPGFSAATCRIT